MHQWLINRPYHLWLFDKLLDLAIEFGLSLRGTIQVRLLFLGKRRNFLLFLNQFGRNLMIIFFLFTIDISILFLLSNFLICLQIIGPFCLLLGLLLLIEKYVGLLSHDSFHITLRDIAVVHLLW